MVEDDPDLQFTLYNMCWCREDMHINTNTNKNLQEWKRQEETYIHSVDDTEIWIRQQHRGN